MPAVLELIQLKTEQVEQRNIFHCTRLQLHLSRHRDYANIKDRM